MKPMLPLLMSVALVVPSLAWAQAGRDSRDSGADARTDALLGTPNRVTPVPQTNRFSTSPGLGQQAPGPYSKPPSMPPPPSSGNPR